MVLNNPKLQRGLLVIFVIMGLSSIIGLAWESQFYVGTFTGYNDFKVQIIWTNTTFISNDTAVFKAGTNVSNPGIYPVNVHLIRVYVTLNEEFYTFATLSTGISDLVPPGSSTTANATRLFVHEPTVTAFQAAQSSGEWNWSFSIDVVFDLGFLEYATRRFNHDFVGTIAV